jgi:hypothetical protein
MDNFKGPLKPYKFNIFQLFSRFIKRIPNRLKSYIFELSLKYIRYYNKDTNYVRHANAEYKIAWPDMDSDKEDKGMQRYMCNQINDLLYLLSSQGDSGSSIGYKLNLFNKLAKFQIISPLTFKDDEFSSDLSLGDDIKQNIRNSAVFKEGDKYTFNDSFICSSKYYIGEENKIIERDGGNWSGGIFVFPENNKQAIYYLCKDWIKDITKFTGKPFYIDVYEIEYPKDWWIKCCKESELVKYKEQYDFEPNYDMLEKELSFKNNQYRQEIIERIVLIRNHMYNK